jgi:hypothetical protein
LKQHILNSRYGTFPQALQSGRKSPYKEKVRAPEHRITRETS